MTIAEPVASRHDHVNNSVEHPESLFEKSDRIREENRARMKAEAAERKARHDPATDKEFLRRKGARESGCDPATGELLTCGNGPSVAVASIGDHSIPVTATPRCQLAMRTLRTDGLQGVRWVRCGRRSCVDCGPKRVELYEREALAASPDAADVRVIVVEEGREWRSLQRKLQRRSRSAEVGFYSAPVGDGRRMVVTDADVDEGRVVDLGDALLELGEQLAYLHSDAEAMKGRRVSVGGSWKKRRDDDRERRERLRTEQKAHEQDVKYLGLLPSAPSPAHVEAVAQNLGARAVPVARVDADVRDLEGNLVVGDVAIIGLSPLTAQVFWKRLGFLSWAELAELRTDRETDRVIARFGRSFKSQNRELVAA
jgi:hypothetical protein